MPAPPLPDRRALVALLHRSLRFFLPMLFCRWRRGTEGNAPKLRHPSQHHWVQRMRLRPGSKAECKGGDVNRLGGRMHARRPSVRKHKQSFERPLSFSRPRPQTQDVLLPPDTGMGWPRVERSPVPLTTANRFAITRVDASDSLVDDRG